MKKKKVRKRVDVRKNKTKEKAPLIIGLVAAELLIVIALVALVQYKPSTSRYLDAELGQLSPWGEEDKEDYICKSTGDFKESESGHDIAITSMEILNKDALDIGDTGTIRIIVSNLGLYEETINISLTESYYPHPFKNLGKRQITISPEETLTLDFSFTALPGSRYYNINLEINYDDNWSNNHGYEYLYLQAEKDASARDIRFYDTISQKIDYGYFIGSTDFIIVIGKDGSQPISNIAYKLEISPWGMEGCNWDDESKCVYSEVGSGTIAILDFKDAEEIRLTGNIEESGEYIIKLTVNSSEDENPDNDVLIGEFETKEAGADLSISSWREDYENKNIYLNQKENLSIEVRNRGNLKADNVTLNISEYLDCLHWWGEEPDCEERFIESKNLGSIGAHQALVILKYQLKTDNLGQKLLKFEIMSDSIDTYPEDNVNRYPYEVMPNGPDPSLRVYYDCTNFLLNEEMYIEGEVYNRGNEIARNVNVSFYEREDEQVFDPEQGTWEWQYNIIGSLIIDELLPDERKEINISYIPTKAGEIDIYTNITSETDVNKENNEYHGGIYVIKNEVDVEVNSIYTSRPYPTFGQTSEVRIELNNLGLSVENAELNLYDNSVLVSSLIIPKINLGKRYVSYSFNWTPSQSGAHSLKAELTVLGDVNLSNNQLKRDYYVYTKTDVTVSIKDSQNNPVTRYLGSDILQGNYGNPIKVDGQKTFATPNLSEVGRSTFWLGVYEIYGLEEEFDEHKIAGAFIMEIESNFSENINIISEVYNKTSYDYVDYYLVFANRISTNARTDDYGMLFNKSFLEKLGIKNLTESTDEGERMTGNYDLIYCTNFDFANKKCSVNWEKAEIGYVDDDEDRLYISAYGKEVIEAFALTDFTGFDDSSTNLSSEKDIIGNFTLERSPYGKIRFLDNINISRFKKDSELLTDYIRIGKSLIKVDTGNLTELKDKRAQLTFWNISLHNPQISYNGQACNSSICTSKSYDSSTKTFLAEVSRFSYFEIVEGPYCGDGTCQSSIGENCSSCSDCGCGSGQVCVNGACEDEEEDEDDNDNNNEGGPTVSCTPSWNCTWSACQNGKQTLNCIDLNKCRKLTGLPTSNGTTKTCLINQNCTDNDNDGYGVGPDCAGPDIDDNDPSITDTLTSDNVGSQDTGGSFIEDNKMFLIIALVTAGIILAVILIIVIIVSLSGKSSRGSLNIKVSEIKRNIKDI